MATNPAVDPAVDPVDPAADTASVIEPEAVGHTVVASYADYAAAQEAVDLLSDKGFPVDTVQIVGHGLKSVEVVTGRMTTLKATLLGALSGIWLGLLVGLLIGLFVNGVLWWQVLALGAGFGALWGAVLGFIGHFTTGGKRDFSSAQGFVASRYELQVESTKAEEAARILAAGR